MNIRPFKALRPLPELAGSVASVPYDTVDSAEARKLAANRPESFLHVTRPEIDLPEGTDMYSDEAYEKAAFNLDNFRKQGILVRENKPTLYVYRQKMDNHVQRGIAACCAVEDYRNNTIRKHEKTRPDKEDDRMRQILKLRAHVGPVFLTYTDNETIDSLVAGIERSEPLFDFTAPDGIDHTVWKTENCEELVNAFKGVPRCYIADGHHRAAAAVRAAETLGGENTGAGLFECVLFPASQLRILPYNRCIKDLNGLSPEAFIREVGKRFEISEDAPPLPREPGAVGMYIRGKWRLLRLKEAPAGNDPVSRLDISILQDNLLEPLAGITNPRTDSRIEFVGGIRDISELTKRVDAGYAAAAFTMYPVTVEQMTAIADADMIMPPKSTWFEPKLRSGLLIHTF